MKLESLFVVSLCAALLSFAGQAGADEYDALFTRAIAAKERALDSNDPASWAQALDLFVSADAVRATKEVKYELGSAAARLRQDDLAVEAFEAALELGLDGSAAEKARAFVSEKQSELGKLNVTGAEGTEIFIGDRLRARLPMAKPIVVFAGARSVRAVHAGRTTTHQAMVKPGATASLALAEPGPTDGEARGAGAPPALPPRDTDEGGSTLGWPLTLGGAGVFVASGVTLLIAGSSLSSHRDRLSTLCTVKDGSDECRLAEPGKRAEAQDEVDAIATWKSVRTGSFVGLGVGAIATGIGVALLLGDKRSSAPASTWIVGPAPAGAGLSVRGAL